MLFAHFHILFQSISLQILWKVVDLGLIIGGIVLGRAPAGLPGALLSLLGCTQPPRRRHLLLLLAAHLHTSGALCINTRGPDRPTRNIRPLRSGSLARLPSLLLPLGLQILNIVLLLNREVPISHFLQFMLDIFAIPLNLLFLSGGLPRKHLGAKFTGQEVILDIFHPHLRTFKIEARVEGVVFRQILYVLPNLINMDLALLYIAIKLFRGELQRIFPRQH